MPHPPANWVSSITGYFLRKPAIAVVLFLVLVAGGTVALGNLRREGFPRVPVKIVVISTVYRGAAAGEVEQSVTNPIESAIKDVRTVKSIASTSAESHSVVIATLNENANVDAGLQDLTSKVSGVTLPNDADKPVVTQPTTGSAAFVFGISGDTSYEKLLAQGRLFAREIEQVKGIKEVKLASDITDRINVKFDPAQLAAARVDQSRLASAVAAGNLNLPAGADLTIDGSRATALVAGRAQSLDDLRAIPVPTLTGGTVTLGSVASIDRAADQNGSINRFGYTKDGLPLSRPGLVYNVEIRSDSDILTVDKGLTAAVERLHKNGTLSSNTQLVRLFDDSANTTRQIDELKAGAIGEKWQGIGLLGYVGYAVGGIWLLMLAMFLFVNLRTALIAGLAIPLSFLFTLMALYLAGYTLNTLTLFAMILILGLVVDPAIVVLESIQRHKDLGFTGKAGVMAAVSAIGKGLFMATLCSVIVFTPFGIVSGVFGEIIKYIPITVIPALIASFFIPLIFLAPLASRFIKAHPRPGNLHDETEVLWAASRWFKRTNLFILRHVALQVVIMLVAVIAPLAVTGYLFASGHVKSAQFSKPHDTTEALATVSYPASFTDAQVDELARQTETAIDQHPEIVSYYYLTQTSNSFTVYMTLTPVTERSTTSEDLMKTLKTELPQNSTKQVYATASRLSAGPPETEFPVSIQIYGTDLAKLKAFALALSAHARATPGVIRVSDDFTNGSTTGVSIQVDKAAAATRGLSPAAVGAQVGSLLGTQPLTKLNLPEGSVDVVSSVAGAEKYTSLADLQRITISSPTGPVALSSIGTLNKDAAAGTISHQNGQRYTTVGAQVNEQTNVYQVQNDLNAWAKSKLAAAGLSPDALESKGEGDDIAKSFINLFQALGVAILMIYLVLALFFGSFLKPIIITFALPLSFLGVFPILALLHDEFGFLEILGLITLAGIVVNVGIFVIDYANHRVAAGMPVKEAIAEATAVRFRPIFLTKITALGSLLPLALLSPFWRGLSSVIIAGILTSGVLSLFTTPILYTWFSGLSNIKWRLGRKARPVKTPRTSGNTTTGSSVSPGSLPARPVEGP